MMMIMLTMMLLFFVFDEWFWVDEKVKDMMWCNDELEMMNIG